MEFFYELDQTFNIDYSNVFSFMLSLYSLLSFDFTIHVTRLDSYSLAINYIDGCDSVSGIIYLFFKSTLYVGEHLYYLVSTLYCFAIAICVAFNV